MKIRSNILIFIICIVYASSSLNFLNNVRSLNYVYTVQENANYTSLIYLGNSQIAYIDLSSTQIIVKNIETLKIERTKTYEELTDKSSICYIKNLNQIVTVLNNQIIILDLSSNQEKRFSIDMTLNNLICLESNHVVLYGKNTSNQVRIFDALSGKIVNSIRNPSSPTDIDIIIIDEDDIIIKTNNSINVYNLYSKKLKSSLKIDTLEIQCLYKNKYIIVNKIEENFRSNIDKMFIKNYIDGSNLSIGHDLPNLFITNCLGNGEFSSLYYHKLTDPWNIYDRDYSITYLYNIDSGETIYLKEYEFGSVRIVFKVSEDRYLVKDNDKYDIYEIVDK